MAEATTMQEEKVEVEGPQDTAMEEERPERPEQRSLAPRLKIYSYNNYKISKKTARVRITHPTFEERMRKLQTFVEAKHVNRVSVYGVILVHQNNYPHLVVLSTNQTGQQAEAIQLPGGTLKLQQNPVDGLKAKLQKKLSLDESISWEIGELLGNFYRTSYSAHLYPYIPAHVTQVKEKVQLYLIHLPETCTFRVLDTYTLLSIPLVSLHNNTDLYSPVIAAIPTLVSRFVVING